MRLTAEILVKAGIYIKSTCQMQICCTGLYLKEGSEETDVHSMPIFRDFMQVK